jgi:hypothetical protein
MDFNRIFRRAKKAVDDRGGTGALMKDAKELASVARGKGSVGDKAKAASKAVRDPGAPGAQDDPTRARAAKDQPRPAADSAPRKAPSEQPPQGA